jgi:hypothetical protein
VDVNVNGQLNICISSKKSQMGKGISIGIVVTLETREDWHKKEGNLSPPAPMAANNHTVHSSLAQKVMAHFSRGHVKKKGRKFNPIQQQRMTNE